MAESTLNDRLQSRRLVTADDDPDAFDDLGAFGLLRGFKERAVMLDIHLKNGNREALAYSLLERVSFDPSEGITLHYYGLTVKMIGRHLARPAEPGASLLEALIRHRVPWVGELDEVRSWTKAAEVTVITKIEIVPKK